MYFPSICVDDFYNDPVKVREMALSLEYRKTDKNGWPGYRSKMLHEIDPNFFSLFTEKLFSLFYQLKKYEKLDWLIESYFQLINPSDYGSINEGWIHRDFNTIFAGIIYLTPDSDVECGTSIFSKKYIGALPANTEYKNEMYLNFDQSKERTYAEKLKENNDQFYETINFGNVFNRLVAYDGSQWHGVKNYSGASSKPRLTQVFFVNEVHSSYFPIPSMRSVIL